MTENVFVRLMEANIVSFSCCGKSGEERYIKDNPIILILYACYISFFRVLH